MGALVTIGGSLREAFFMFWETLWALVLGFGLAVLAVIYWLHRSQERLGGRDVARDPVCGMQVDKHHPGAVLRATGTRRTSALSTAGITTPDLAPPPPPTSARIPAAAWRPRTPAKDSTMPESVTTTGPARPWS
jgi:hypothetical protein